MRSSARRAAEKRGKKITVVGLGNTGSHLVPLLADIPDLEHVQLVDGGVYEAGNLGCQAILPRDVGRPKALVQAGRLRQLNAALRVEPYVQWLEHVPWGNLRSAVILCCVDSRVARQWINEIAWRLGVVWIDLAVDATHLLARLNAYSPGAAAPCLECAWNDEDYAALEQVYACGPEHAASAPTRAPSSLGAVPAALAATELHKLLESESDGLLSGRQVLCDLRHHEYWVTRYERNPACRFDHQPWIVTPFPCALGSLTWRRLLQAVCPDASLEAVFCRVAGQSFTRLLRCARCGLTALDQAVLEHRLPRRVARCATCHEPMRSAGVDAADWLSAANLDSGQRMRSRLADAGVRAGDILSVRSPHGQRHVELTALPRRPSRRSLTATGAEA